MTSKKTKVLSRLDFLSAVNSFKRELLDVPELGGAVYIGELSAAQILEFNERVSQLKKDGETTVTPSVSVELMTLLVSMSVCDEYGKPLFSVNEAEKLSRINISALLSMSTKVLEISGLDNAKIREVADNLKKARSDSSVPT